MKWLCLESQVGEGKREVEYTHAAKVPGGVIVKHEAYRSGGASPALSESMVLIPGDLQIVQSRTGSHYEIVERPTPPNPQHYIAFSRDALIDKIMEAALEVATIPFVNRSDFADKLRKIFDAEKQQS